MTLPELESLRLEVRAIARDIAIDASIQSPRPSEAAPETIAPGASVYRTVFLASAPVSHPGDPAQLSYGLPFLPEFDQARQALAGLAHSIAAILARLAPEASIESPGAGSDAWAARTAVNYTGRALSVWCGEPDSAQIRAHQAAVQSTLAFRAAAVGVVAEIGCTLMAISAALANPLLLPRAIGQASRLRQKADRFLIAIEGAL